MKMPRIYPKRIGKTWIWYTNFAWILKRAGFKYSEKRFTVGATYALWKSWISEAYR